MDFEEEDDDLFNAESDASDYEYTDEDDEDMPWGVEAFTFGIVRVPKVLLQSTTALLLCPRPEDRPIMCESLQRAWMGAVALKFPDTPLAVLRSRDPCLVPAWLLERGYREGFASCQVMT
jgi:hypothetical protein